MPRLDQIFRHSTLKPRVRSSAVTPVNNAPVATGTTTLASVPQDTVSPAGATASSLFTVNFSDAADGSVASLYGVAITANAATGGQGVWQYSANGGANWSPVGAPTTAAALIVQASHLLRFLPTAGYSGTPGALTATLIETGGATPITGSTVNLTGATGGVTIYSAASVPLGTTITAPTGSTIATPSVTPGWVTGGLAIPQGQVPAGQSVVLGALSTQTDVKATWPDGSAKHLVYTAKATATGPLAIAPGTPAGGTFTPVIQPASVEYNIGGTIYTATMPLTVNTGARKLNGALVQSWRHFITPMNGATPHPFLRVLFEYRAYSDGQGRVDICGENCLSNPLSDAVTYDLTVTVAGNVVLSLPGTVQGFTTRWRRVYNIGLTESFITHDFTPFFAAKAFPRYNPNIGSSTWNSATAAFALMGRGGIQYDDMGAPGAHLELAPFPDWTAQYLVHQTLNQRDFNTTCANQAAAWPCHLRWHTAGEMPKCSNHPDIWMDYRQSASPAVPVADRIQCANYGLSTDALKVGRGPLAFNAQHVSQISLVAYLTTGDEFHSDEMAFWANGLLLVERAARGAGGTLGLVIGPAVRHIAWSLRILAEAAAFLPDTHELKAFLAVCTQNNLDYIDSVIAGPVDNTKLPWRHPTGALPTSFEVFDTADFPTMLPTAPILQVIWQMHYFLYSIARCNHIGFTGGLLQLNRAMDFMVRMLTSTGSGFNSDCAASNFIVIGEFQSNEVVSQGHYTISYVATTMAELFTWNNTNSGNNATWITRSGFNSNTALHWGNYARSIWTACVLCVYHGQANAAAALAECKAKQLQYGAVFVQNGFNFMESIY